MRGASRSGRGPARNGAQARITVTCRPEGVAAVVTEVRASTGGAGEVSVEGSTVGEVLESLYVAHADLKDRLADEDGTLRRFVNVYVDGEDIRFGDGLQTAVPAGGEVQILPAVAGG